MIRNSATWLSAPALSNLDGYVSASERGRHGQCTYITDLYARTHTLTHTHTHICSQVRHSPDKQTALGVPRQLSRAGKWKNVLLSGDAVSHTAVQIQQLSVQRAKGHSIFIQLSLTRQLWNIKWNSHLSFSVSQETIKLINPPLRFKGNYVLEGCRRKRERYKGSDEQTWKIQRIWWTNLDKCLYYILSCSGSIQIPKDTLSINSVAYTLKEHMWLYPKLDGQMCLQTQMSRYTLQPYDTTQRKYVHGFNW